VQALQRGLSSAGLDPKAVQMVPTADRAAVGALLSGLGGAIDLIVPRGGKSLVERVQSEARVPVFSHLEGICHVYVDRDADISMATSIIVNAKMRRTGVCGSAETVLVDRPVAAQALPAIIGALAAAGCEIRGDENVRAFSRDVKAVTEEDWSTEYLDAIISIRVVDGVQEAMDHIATYGSQHTDAIVTANTKTAEAFLSGVDSAIVLHNASTQFADGGEFGFGAEIGIATGKLHARGPVGVEQLTTFKYQIRGSGQKRP
jgi:glutamate-5-semialdehyde dehydrogenase